MTAFGIWPKVSEMGLAKSSGNMKQTKRLAEKVNRRRQTTCKISKTAWILKGLAA
jgi:hypothetical protein